MSPSVGVGAFTFAIGGAYTARPVWGVDSVKENRSRKSWERLSSYLPRGDFLEVIWRKWGFTEA